MKHKPPSFQFYPKQWLGDDKVMLMDWDARGMHIHLICISWQQSQPGTIPNDEVVIRRWLKEPSEKSWARVWPQIKSAWKIWGKNSDFLYSRGVFREYRKIKAFSKKQQKNAKQLWDNRRSQGMSLAYAKTMPRHDSGNARAGNALQSSPSGLKSTTLTPLLNLPPKPARSAPPDAPATRAEAFIVADERQDLGHGDFLAHGRRSSQMPTEPWGWEHLEKSLDNIERVQSKMREKFYGQPIETTERL